MQPRIYTYKVTFEETPDWYWGAHKEEKYGEPYLGSPKTHAWKWGFYTPHLQICEIFPYTDEGWTQAREVEDSCIKPDLNNPLCLNEHYGGLMSLEACRRRAKKLHEEKDENGKSLHALKMNESQHKERDEGGKSLHAIKMHKEKDEEGKSLHAIKMSEAQHKEKDENGLSLYAVEKLGLPRKAVVVTFPDGSKQQFKSICETARFLCVNEKAVIERIRKGPSSKKSKLAGYRFELV